MSDHAVEHDPNTESGFEAMLAEKVGATRTPEQLEEAASRDTSVASGLTVEESSQRQRDDQGRFVAPPAAEQPQEEVAPQAPAEEQTEQVDPAFAALIEKHGGDVQAAALDAWRQNQEAQSLVGKHAQEVGEARKEREELIERLARLEGRLEATPQVPTGPVIPVSGDDLENMMVEHGGQNTMAWVAENRPDLIEPFFDMWAENQPGPALRWRSRYDSILRSQEQEGGGEAAAPAIPEEYVQILEQQKRDAENRAVLDSLETQVTEAEGAPMWQAIKGQMIPALQQAPALIQNAVESTDPATRRMGIEALVPIAKGLALRSASEQVTSEVQQQQTATKLAASQVAGPGSIRNTDRQPEPTSEAEASADRIARFKKALLEEETTSVAAGLTYGS